MSKKKKLPGWRDIPIGGVIDKGGTSIAYETGSWRSKRPNWIEDKCIHCLACWILCPDSAIDAKDEKFSGFDYDHCKGCGICAHECPVDAIEMKQEQRS